MALIILCTQSVFNAASMSNYHLPVILVALLFVRVLTLMSLETKVGKLIIFSVLWILYISVYILVSPGKIFGLIQVFVVYFLLMVIYIHLYKEKNDFKQLLRMYSNIIFILAIISLFFWLFGSIAGIIKPTGSLPINWGGNVITSSYFNIYFQWQHDAVVFGHTIFRNIGIFCEAPMYSLNLSVAFIFDYLINGRKSLSRFAVYLITIASTVSVTGVLLILGVVTMSKLFEYLEDTVKHNRFRFGLILFPIFAIIAIALGYQLLTNKLSSASGSSRMQDYISGFKAWMVHPFFGSGYGNIATRISFSSFWRLARSETGYTNSIMTILSEGGVYFFTSFFVSFFYLLKKAISKNDYKLGIFTIVWIYLFLTTVFAHTMLLVGFLACVFELILSDYKITI
ncbi:polymerase [Pediococcus claussenii]|uniref:polymerase n=1 Tax=Pediococcus claussenii TaxID=187452 RepID=UPI001E51A0AA|nr:polymerase [Pediococcus claussenii]